MTKTIRGKKSINPNSALRRKILLQIRGFGDSIERAGERVEKKGWETIGQAIYKLGNTLEHIQEKKVLKIPARAKTLRTKAFSGSTEFNSGAGKNDSRAL